MRVSKVDKKKRRGAAAIIVLFIIMAVTLLSLGFIARSDTELQCGNNMALRMQMDYLAYSGLTHGKALIANDAVQPSVGPVQIGSTSDYYEFSIAQIADPNLGSVYEYNVQAMGYRKIGTDPVAQSVLNAKVYYDPNDAPAYFMNIKRN